MSGEMCSECDGYEVVIVDGEEVHCATCSLRAEMERLRAAVDVVLFLVGNHHRPNSDGRGCWWCGPGDGSWPCVHRMVLDELKEARRG